MLKRYGLLIAILCLTSLVFANGLLGGFVFDDFLFLKQPCWQADRVWEIFGIFNAPDCQYRPLRYLSYAIDHVIGGKSPLAYHVTNLALHLICTTLIFSLLRRVSSFRASLILALLVWSIHPVHTDTVTYIAGRRDLLFTALYLAALLAWPLSETHRHKALFRSLVSVFCFVLALAAKEMAITFPVVLLLWNTFQKDSSAPFPDQRSLRNELKKNSLWYGVSGAVSLGYFLYFAVLNPFSDRAGQYWGNGIREHVLTVISTYPKYLEFLLFPLRLYGDYSDFRIAQSFFDLRFLVGSVLLVFLFIGIVAFRRRFPTISFGITWFMTTMLPVSQIIPHHEILAEHYLYLPSIGLVFPLAEVFRRYSAIGPRARTTVVVGAGCLIALFSGLTVDRNRDFRSADRFYETIIRNEPKAIRARSMKLAYLIDSSRFAEAEETLNWLLKNTPPGNRFRYEIDRNHLVYLLRTAQSASAERKAESMIERYPKAGHAYRVLGTILFQKGEIDRGLALQKKAFEMDPTDLESAVHLATSEIVLGLIPEGSKHLEDARRISSDHPSLRLPSLLLAYRKARQANDREEACRFYEILSKEFPSLQIQDRYCSN